MNKKFKIFIKKNSLDNKTPKKIVKYVNDFASKNKFWKPENLLGEIIEPENIDVDALLKKDELCPDIWDENEKMYPDVRNILLKNALAFIKFAKLDNAKFNDIVLTGSLANYNWHEGSDLDIHILMDFNQISVDSDLIEDYFSTKKALWLEKMPVKVKGHDVELYIQNINEPHTSTGVYSIWNDEWKTKPIKEMIGVDTNNIQKKSIDFMKKIDDLEKLSNEDDIINKATDLMDKLKIFRKIGLENSGEFSTENLVFKILRNTGYLKKLLELKYDNIQKELTLEEFINSKSTKDKLKELFKNVTIALGFAIMGIAFNTINDDELINLGIKPETVIKAKNYVFHLDNDDLEKLKNEIKTFPKYINKKLKELDNEILN